MVARPAASRPNPHADATWLRRRGVVIRGGAGASIVCARRRVGVRFGGSARSSPAAPARRRVKQKPRGRARFSDSSGAGSARPPRVAAGEHRLHDLASSIQGPSTTSTRKRTGSEPRSWSSSRRSAAAATTPMPASAPTPGPNAAHWSSRTRLRFLRFQPTRSPETARTGRENPRTRRWRWTALADRGGPSSLRPHPDARVLDRSRGHPAESGEHLFVDVRPLSSDRRSTPWVCAWMALVCAGG
jgi:hypothetical protein